MSKVSLIFYLEDDKMHVEAWETPELAAEALDKIAKRPGVAWHQMETTNVNKDMDDDSDQ